LGVKKGGLSLTSFGLILLEVLNEEKALPRWRVATGFIISIPYKSKLLRV
jgi:hypothetical protein